ncbi:hypothetical protein PG993_013345 [Apiospora rasikravindrae]|uniref:RRM domain-containing protein n=1 Tax=Apiospora rasikravindrae TaxID=990691 RepID=A0ABR1RXG8_9PEZI
MPEHWISGPERTAPRPALTFEQREQIAALWVTELQPDLLYWLSRSANLDEVKPTKFRSHLTTLRVTAIDWCEEAVLRSLFEAFGPLTHFSMPRRSGSGEPLGYAYVDFASPVAAAAACRHLDGYGHEHMTMSIKFAHCVCAATGAPAPGLLVEYPSAEGHEFVIRKPLLRATAELQDPSPNSTYATIVVATSWELKEKRKRELEVAKKAVLGSRLDARVFLAYDTCEPPSQ